MKWLRRLFGLRTDEGEPISGIKYKEREVKDGNTYEVYTGPSRSRALEFLRGTEVKEERRYVVVETPEGCLGRDLIMIFDEANSERIEFGIRNPLPELTKSKTHCTRCGYPVVPAGRWIVSPEEPIPLDQMREQGAGFYCSTCLTSWCPFCVTADSAGTCQLCGAHMDIYRDWVLTMSSGLLPKCGGCGSDQSSALEVVRDKNNNRGYLCSSCQREYAALLKPDSIRRFWMCGACGFRILAGTKADAEVDPDSKCPQCGEDVNSSLVNLSDDRPVESGMFGEPVE